jgi:hypothetical protein
MAKRRSKPVSPFLGRWHIVSMTEWDEDYIHEEVPAFIEFGEHQQGSFQFAYVRGEIDYRITTRDGEPAVEWSWEGNDDQNSMSGRGWAMLKSDELHGMIFIHQGDDSEFVADRTEPATKDWPWTTRRSSSSARAWRSSRAA